MRKIGSLLVLLLTMGTVQAHIVSDAAGALARGRELYEFGRWTDARHAFMEARRMVTTSDLAQREAIDYYLAACAVELGHADAEEALRNFMRNYPGSTFNNAVRFALASYYCSMGAMEKARAAFEACDYKALNRSERERYHMRRGYVAFTERNYEEAYALFNRIDDQSRYAEHADYYRAYMDYSENRLPQAKERFRALRTSTGYGEIAPYYLLQIEFREGNYRYVVDEGEPLVERTVGERKAELERLLAEAWFRLEEYRKTLEHLDAAVATGGEEDRETAYLRGFSHYRLTHYEAAIEGLRRACGPNDELTRNASYHLADCYLRMGQKCEAMQAFALAADKGQDADLAEDALFNYAKLQYELGGGLFDGAIRQLNRYMQEYPTSPRVAEACTLLVAAYYNSRNYDAAYRAIKAMPTMDAELKTALQKITYFRALEAYKTGERSAARRYLNETVALGVSPRYTALATFWQGEIAFEEGDYRGATAKYESYIRRAPRGEREYALAWYNLGYCHLHEGALAEAESAFNNFLAAHPNRDAYRSDALNRLGDAAYADRRFEQALTHYNRTLAEGGKGSDYAAYKRATTLGVLGRPSEQQRALQQLIATNRSSYAEEAAYDLAASYMRQGDYHAAAVQFERYLATYPTAERSAQVAKELGLAYLNLGEHAKALKAYDAVVITAPQSQAGREALQAIREIYVSEGNVDGYFAYAAKVGVESDLTTFSRDSLSFVAAQKLYLADRRDEAARSLRSYLKSYPKGAYRADALHDLAQCYLQMERSEEAIPVLEELADLGSSAYTLSALRSLSELTWQAKQYDRAARAAHQLFGVATNADEREAAMTRYVRATVAAGDKEAVSKMAGEVIAQHEAGATAQREAKFAWAEQLRAERRTAAAGRLYKELSEEVATAEGSAAAYYVIEYAFADGKGDLDKTEQAVFALSERSPRAYWLAKAYLLLGDLYVKKGDLFQARATYQSVADGYSPTDDGIVEAAKSRIEKLNQ